MKTSCLVVVLAVFSISSYFLLITAAEAASSKQQAQFSWPVNHARRIKRDVSSNHTSTVNRTQVQNLITTTGAPTKAPTYRRPNFGRPWPTKRRPSARPTGSAMNSNSTGLSEVQMENQRGNRSRPELDHLGFPMIPNSHRGTRQPPPLTKHNASNNTPHTQNPVNDRNGSFLHEMMAELRERENGTQTSTLRSNTATSTISIERSSKVPHTEGTREDTRNDNRRGISLVNSKHSIWIAVISSLILTTFCCLAVHWVRQRRRGKLTIAPASNKGQRSAAVVFKA